AGDAYEAFDASYNSSPGGKSKGLTLRHGSGSSPEHLPKGLTTRSADAKIRFSFTDALDFGALESMLYNDLQDIVVAKKKAIGKIIKRLASSLGKRAIVSGSGPSVFCLFRSRKEAVRAKDLLLSGIPAGKRKGWQIFVAETMY
ncbi:MAG: hypothetical protein Q8N91_01900, partial [Candidatus Omnitrophota bacterium]|nr:hypothetical protein [Candidatus Omnitrophota bacterium]